MERRLFPLLAVLAVACPCGASAASQNEDCEALMAQGDAAFDALDVNGAEAAFRAADERCGDGRAARRLARTLFAQSQAAPDDAARHAVLDEARRVVTRAPDEGLETPELLLLRAAILGALAPLVTERIEAARLLLAVHRDTTRALALSPDEPVGLVILGAWNRRAAALGFMERAFVRLTAGELPDASLDESRRLLERAVARDPTPTALFHLGLTFVDSGQVTAARDAFTACIARKPTTPRDLAVPGWCSYRLSLLGHWSGFTAQESAEARATRRDRCCRSCRSCHGRGGGAWKGQGACRARTHA